MSLERLTLGVTDDDIAVFVKHITDPVNAQFVMCGVHTIYRDSDDVNLIHIPRIDCKVCANKKEAL